MYDFFNQNDQENNTLLQFDNAVVNQFSCKCIWIMLQRKFFKFLSQIRGSLQAQYRRIFIERVMVLQISQCSILQYKLLLAHFLIVFPYFGTAIHNSNKL